jgi:hypothetical protein
VSKRLDTWELRDLLRTACEAAGSQQAWARQHKVSDSYVSDVLAGKKEPGESITSALGYKRAVVYVPDAWEDQPQKDASK